MAPPASEKVGLLKHVWRHWGFRRIFLERRFDTLQQDWKATRERINPAAGVESNILIIPSDPELLTNSTGDQAMIGAIMAHWRGIYPDARFYAAVADQQAGNAARARGIQPLSLLTPDASFELTGDVAQASAIGTVVAMGADVLDGSYNVAFSGRQLMLLDILARSGARCFITGFSVSENFHPRIVRLFDELDPSISINLRDPVSFERFRHACARPASLVADVAFLLEPRHTDLTAQITQWIEAQRRAGYAVLGVNCHPLLLELEERHQLGRFLNIFAETIIAFLGMRKVALLLIDHDSRGSSADAICLGPLYEQLKARTEPKRLNYPETRLSADEIKAVVGALDGVISGRMHLMIAAMGAGTPVFGIDYKDKMEGLLSHFGLPTGDLCTAADFMKPDNGIAGRMADFVDRLESIGAQVAVARGDVTAAAKQNFGAAF